MGVIDSYHSFSKRIKKKKNNGIMASKTSYPSGAEKWKKKKIDEENRAKDKGKLIVGDMDWRGGGGGFFPKFVFKYLLQAG